MADDTGVTLQINLAPTDAPHAHYTVPHQLRQLGGQVDEILLVVDLHQSRGRYAEQWQERLPRLRGLIAELCASDTRIHTVDTDYAQPMAGRLADAYCGGRPIPAKDWMGAPIYAYLFGLHAASHRYVMHMDSDMLFGGGSQTWVAEAIARLEARPEAIACNPLPGPPTADGQLRSQTLERDARDPFTHYATGLSTRIFFLDRERLHERIPTLPVIRPPRLRAAQAWVEGNPAYAPLEAMFTQGMENTGSVRIDFLGADPGLWAVHPMWRTPLFYERLPEVIAQIEAGDIPEGQRGYHDLNSTMMDWTGAVPSRWGAYRKHATMMLRRFQAG